MSFIRYNHSPAYGTFDHNYWGKGSVPAQLYCAKRFLNNGEPNFSDSWWTNTYIPCRDQFDSGVYAWNMEYNATNLQNSFNNLAGSWTILDKSNKEFTEQLATCNTSNTALTAQLNTCNAAKNSLQTQLNTCNNNASTAAITCNNNKATTATAHQLELSNAINNCQISIATARAQQLEQDNIRCAGEKTTAIAQQLSEDNTRCANEKTSAVATGRAQQKIEDDAACYSANPTTTKPEIFRENILLQTQLISQLKNLVGDTQNKLTINEPFKSYSQSQYQSNSQSKSNFENTHNIPRTHDLPDLYALNKIYDTSIALSDDPLSYNQVAFDTYMHLQDKKINTLQQNMASINSQLGKAKNPPIKAFRNMSNSHVLNVEGYPNPTATNNGQPTTYKGNGASDYPNYLIYGNNGCLQYNQASPSSNNVPSALSTPATYSFASCNASKPNQQFYAKQITNINEYNAPITDINNATYKINNSNNALMGFYVVNPINARNQCLQINNDGLSVMPCNMDASQRFKPMYRHAIP